jgi:hypothetical protein
MYVNRVMFQILLYIDSIYDVQNITLHGKYIAVDITSMMFQIVLYPEYLTVLTMMFQTLLYHKYLPSYHSIWIGFLMSTIPTQIIYKGYLCLRVFFVRHVGYFQYIMWDVVWDSMSTQAE